MKHRDHRLGACHGCHSLAWGPDEVIVDGLQHVWHLACYTIAHPPTRRAA